MFDDLAIKILDKDEIIVSVPTEGSIGLNDGNLGSLTNKKKVVEIPHSTATLSIQGVSAACMGFGSCTV